MNVREYLSVFTTKAGYLTPADIQADFAELSRFLRARGLLVPPTVLSGVSEGAGIAVVAAAGTANHEWVSGVITLGLPEISEIAWRWSDFTSWITKKDADEPSVKATEFLASVSPIPLVMIQSTHDEGRVGARLSRHGEYGARTEAAGADRGEQSPVHGSDV